MLFACITAFFWGFLAIALKVASGIMDPLTIVWFRFLTAFTVLLVIFAFTRPHYLKILTGPPLYLIIASLGLGINYVAFLYGLKLTSPSTAQIIIQVVPIMLGMVGLVFFKEKISRRQAMGFLIAGAGLVFFYYQTLSGMVANEDLFNMGVLWILVGAMAWVTYATFQKILVRKFPAQQLNLFLFGFPILVFLPFIKPEQFLTLTPGNWLLLIYLGLNTLIAYGSLALAFKYLEANKVSMIITMNPILTFIIMALLTYWEVTWIEPETMTPERVVAALLVLAGAVMAVAFARPEKKKEIDQIISRTKD